MNYDFDENIYQALIGGMPPMDVPISLIGNDQQATDFLMGYGYDLHSEADQIKLWEYYDRALEYIKSEMIPDCNTVFIPHRLANRNQLGTFHNLIKHASNKLEEDSFIKNWACAILKVIHVLVHLDNDLFSQFSTSIQEQVLAPFEKHILRSDTGELSLDPLGDPRSKPIPLFDFSMKYFKRSDSSVTKLLAKPQQVAFTVLDKVGVRFITKNYMDVFRVMSFLVRQNIINVFHMIPDQSNNSLYPIDLFMEVISHPELDTLSDEKIDALLQEKLKLTKTPKYLLKTNEFTGANYKFMKFICRRLIKVGSDNENHLTFFYPFEIQIVDHKSHLGNQSGLASHDEYKQRQRNKARSRVLNFL